MNKLITIIILAFAINSLSAQSFKDLIVEYEKECAELVPDTVEQMGVITHHLIPVIKDGEITHYVEGSVDTVWRLPNCAGFKNPSFSNYTGSVFFGGGISGGILYADTTFGATTSWTIKPTKKVIDKDGTILFVDQSATSYKTFIEKPYVCMIKDREVQPFSEHFWNWIKDRKE